VEISGVKGVINVQRGVQRVVLANTGAFDTKNLLIPLFFKQGAVLLLLPW
jgi:hypothetical protein